MDHTLIKTDNELILKRRKKKKLEKLFMLFILLIAMLSILCLKLPYFNVKNIQVYGNKSITDKSIIAISNIYLGNNIFYIDMKSSINSILSNPYISDVSISRKLPSTININVKERDAVYYGIYNNKYYVIDQNGIVLQIRNDINGMKLIKLDGIDYSKCSVGKIIGDSDKRKLDAVSGLGDIIENSKAELNITSVDVSNSADIKVYFGSIYIKLGNASELDKKLNEALNILSSNQLKGATGYIDVSFHGNPVFSIQK